MKNLKFIEIQSNKPGKWFKFNVLLDTQIVGTFETQVDLYNLEGKSESVYTIYKIKIEKEFRRKGIGSKIIEYCQQLALKKGENKILCWIKPLDNKISKNDLIAFYKKCGMRLVDHAQSDNLYAIKDLTSP